MHIPIPLEPSDYVILSTKKIMSVSVDDLGYLYSDLAERLYVEFENDISYAIDLIYGEDGTNSRVGRLDIKTNHVREYIGPSAYNIRNAIIYLLEGIYKGENHNYEYISIDESELREIISQYSLTKGTKVKRWLRKKPIKSNTPMDRLRGLYHRHV